MPVRQVNRANAEPGMSMTRLVIGAALGFLVAQGLLYGLRHAAGRLQRDEVLRRIARIRELLPARGSTFMAAFVRYAGVIGVSAALITLAAWAIGDYWTAKSTPTTANAFGPAPAPGSDATPSSEDPASLAPAPSTHLPGAAEALEDADPYADGDFKVRRAVHRPGAALSLKETLVQRSEAKARAELLQEIQQHAQRSQYDCEAADRANRYLKAGLDVWGFTAWQFKHFPLEKYRGAALARCKDIKNVVDPAWPDLRSTIAQQSHP